MTTTSPIPDTEIRSLSRLMEELRASLAPMDRLTIGALAEALHERGIGMLLLIFATPMALPIPVPPGINIMLASPLVLLTIQQALGRHTVWLPRRMTEKPLSKEKFDSLLVKMIPWVRKTEILLRPRLGWATWDGPSRLFGFLGLLMALVVMIPVPMTNTIPSMGIALMAAGTIMRDGLAVIIGAMIGMAWITVLVTAIALFGPEAFDIVKEAITSVF